MVRSAQVLEAASVAVSIILAGCGSSLPVPPTAPTSTRSPAPEPAMAERWNLTTTLRSVTGPENCNAVIEADIGESFLWQMTIERSGGSVRLIVSLVADPMARLEYEGTDVEDVLTAAIKGRSGKTVCEGSMTDVFNEANVSGRFSEDGRVLAAEELKSFKFNSGEIARFYYDWHAARQ
jgi:hypothetical protein